MERLPNETLVEYYDRLKKLRGSLLGTGGMMDQPLVDPEVVQTPTTSEPLAEVVVQQAVQDPDDGDEYQPEKDTPEKAAARKQALLERQLRATLGQDGTSYSSMTQGASMLGGPMFGLAALGLGEFADKFERDSAALELGRRLGFKDVEEAKKEGYKYLDNADLARQLLDQGGVSGLDPSLLTPQKPKKSVLSQFFGGLFGIGDDEPTTPPPVYTGIEDLRANVSMDGMMTDSQRRAGTDNFTSTVNQGKSVAEILAEQKARNAQTAIAQANQAAADAAMYGGDDNNEPSGGGTPLSEVGGTVESIANANQDAAYEAMGGFYR